MFKNDYQEGSKMTEFLTFVRRDPNSKSGRPAGIFSCVCGKEFSSRFDAIKNGKTKSCGCQYKKLISQSGLGRKHTEEAKAKIGDRFRGISNDRRTIQLISLPENDKNRFWNKIAITANPDKCWEWLGSKRKGYGYMTIQVAQGIQTTINAIRMVYFLFYGIDPSDKIIRHKCDNKSCVNPHHLELGTARDNAMDMVSRGGGYFPKGSAHGRSKLKEDQVLDIREAFEKGETQGDIASKYQISQSAVSDIVKKRRWKHI